MTMVVHLADERSARAVKRSGVRGGDAYVSTQEGDLELDDAVFVTPVLQNYFLTHQWLRELKRKGMKTLVGVYIKMRSDVTVLVGRYSQEHVQMRLGCAVGLFMKEQDARGWQIIIPRSIPAKAIHDIRPVPQIVGWRYFPESNATGPLRCLCSMCSSGLRGTIKGMKFQRSLLKRYSPDDLNYESAPDRLARIMSTRRVRK